MVGSGEAEPAVHAARGHVGQPAWLCDTCTDTSMAPAVV